MTDSSSFSSLLALVDSHLSKTKIQESHSEDTGNGFRIPIPPLNKVQNGTMSETRLNYPPGRLLIPSISTGESSIKSVLAEQVANMLKAKELKRQQEEEKQRLEEEMKKLKIEENEHIIDLMQALQTPFGPGPPQPALSSSSSCESLFEVPFIDCDQELEKPKTPEPLLPCKRDMSYILHQKVRKGKCSAFGRVLTARVRPVAAPYLREKVESNVVRFNFKTKSPCDLIKEKLRKPTSYNTYNFDIYSAA